MKRGGKIWNTNVLFQLLISRFQVKIWFQNRRSKQKKQKTGGASDHASDEDDDTEESKPESSPMSDSMLNQVSSERTLGSIKTEMKEDYRTDNSSPPQNHAPPNPPMLTDWTLPHTMTPSNQHLPPVTTLPPLVPGLNGYEAMKYEADKQPHLSYDMPPYNTYFYPHIYNQY
uniref:Homeobox domain-containing protein n=1 Tax=Caenorhabditis tropicalis TaxID=1561998 RepID=A0A1I7V4Z5_9PELO